MNKKTGGWPGSHKMPCGLTFPLNDSIDSLVILIHQEFCVVDQAEFINAMAEIEGGGE